MELRWIEDFLSVADAGHFSRAADERHITQSTLSRRIKALENWAGAELLDRSSHPIALTEAGAIFASYAYEIMEKAHDARGAMGDLTALGDRNITISCLHTLSLKFAPTLVAELAKTVSPFSANIVAETRTIEEYLTALSDGASDVFICYGHPAVPISIDAERFPCVKIGEHLLAPYQKFGEPPIDLENGTLAVPYLEFSGTSFMSRIVQHILGSADCRGRLQSVYRASLAEGLAAACKEGLGVAWLPDTVVGPNPRESGFQRVMTGREERLGIYMYRYSQNQRQIVDDFVASLNGQLIGDQRV